MTLTDTLQVTVDPASGDVLSAGIVEFVDEAAAVAAATAAANAYTDARIESLPGGPTLAAVRCAATSNYAGTYPFTGLPGVFDDVTVADGDRVMLPLQTSASRNGIWIASTGAWVRPSDYTGAVPDGKTVEVLAGTANALTTWEVTGSGTIGTNTTTWTKLHASLVTVDDLSTETTRAEAAEAARLLAADNLSDVPDPAAALANLGGAALSEIISVGQTSVDVGNRYAGDIAAAMTAEGDGKRYVLTDAVHDIATRIIIRDGTDLVGFGHGQRLTSPGTSSTTKIRCTTPTAQVSWGERTVESRGGESGGFVIDGNAVATQPAYWGLAVQRSFRDIAVIGAASGADYAAIIEAAQNCTFESFDVENNGSGGLVFDYGAGNNLLVRPEIRGNGAGGHANLAFRQSGSSPAGAFTVPTGNRLVGGVIEQPDSAADCDVLHGNGRLNCLDGTDLASTGRASAFSVVKVRRTDTTKPSALFRLRSVAIHGTSAQTTAVDVQSASGTSASMVLEGLMFLENHLDAFLVDDFSTTLIEGLLPNDVLSSGVTNLFVNAAGGTKSWYQVLLQQRRLATQFTAAAPGDTVLSALVSGDAKNRWAVTGNGFNAWTDGGSGTTAATLGYSTIAGASGLLFSTGIKISGTGAALLAGTGVPTIGAANGSIFMRTDGGSGSTMYARVSGAWVAVA